MTGVDATHDPALTSWVPGADGHADFPIQNLPLGVFERDGWARGGVAIGPKILDLAALADAGMLDGDALLAARAGADDTLNVLLALGAGPRGALRRQLSILLSDPSYESTIAPMLHDAADCRMQLPVRIGDFTDFYVGIHHARNVGALFRPDNPLLPNYKHVPIGYHGRASSVRVSGHPVVRPQGQVMAAGAAGPELRPTRRLDYELELGVWIGPGNALGTPIPIARAAEHFAGLSLLNDWSARDVQAWEYQPLGPFLAKNFLTTVSPWIVTAEALAPFRIAQPPRPDGDPAPLPYLNNAADQARGAFAIDLDVTMHSAAMRRAGLPATVLSRGGASGMYWTVAQMIAHHAVGGCNLNPGDLLGTGTLSGPGRESYGSLLEITRGGADPIALPSGETRTFLEDGDVVEVSGRLRAPGFVGIGFGACIGIVMPAASCAGVSPTTGIATRRISR